MSKKYVATILLLIFFFPSSALSDPFFPPLPHSIGGTVTIDNVQLTQSMDTGYTFKVTKQDGTDYTDFNNMYPEDTDGLNTSNWYLIDIPIYDPDSQPMGAHPGDTAVIHIYKDGTPLNITAPSDGQFTVGNSNTETRIDLAAVSPPVLILSVTPLSQNIPPDGGTAAFEIENTGNGTMNWTASKNTEWFSAAPISGENNGTITITCNPNPGEERTGTLTIQAPGAANSPQTVEIKQTACDAKAVFTATVRELTATFDPDGSLGNLSFDYGDGNTGTETTYTYAKAGTYTVTLTTSPYLGCTASATKNIDIQAFIPTVATVNITSVTLKTAVSGGSVTQGGGVPVTARGVCWNLSEKPTVENSHTSDGTGTGSFTSSITGLTPDTTYYVRAYAANSAGVGYGSEKAFKTLPPIPGDINGDGKIDLQDAILALKIISGIKPPEVYTGADVNDDKKIGIEEVFYILRQIIEEQEEQ